MLFAGIGLIHIFLGKEFIQLSDQKLVNSQNLTKHKLVNLLFYITFGMVVVKAVLIGGIFMVFTLLIAPSTAAAMYSKEWKGRLIWSCVIGITGTVTGILLSYLLNISNGPAIVCLLGSLVFILAFIKISTPIHRKSLRRT